MTAMCDTDSHSSFKDNSAAATKIVLTLSTSDCKSVVDRMAAYYLGFAFCKATGDLPDWPGSHQAPQIQAERKILDARWVPSASRSQVHSWYTEKLKSDSTIFTKLRRQFDKETVSVQRQFDKETCIFRLVKFDAALKL